MGTNQRWEKAKEKGSQKQLKEVVEEEMQQWL